METIRTRYRSGELSTGELKERCYEVLVELVTKIQEVRSPTLIFFTKTESSNERYFFQRRKTVTPEILKKFMDFSTEMKWTVAKAPGAVDAAAQVADGVAKVSVSE